MAEKTLSHIHLHKCGANGLLARFPTLKSHRLAVAQAPNSLWASITLQTLKYRTVNHSICHDIHPPHPHPSILALLRTVLGFPSFPFQLHNLHTPAQPCRNRQWLKEKGPHTSPQLADPLPEVSLLQVQTSALVNTTPTTSQTSSQPSFFIIF